MPKKSPNNSNNEENEKILPWQRPKRKEEEPRVLELVRRIMEDPSYRLAEEDPEFIKSPRARGIRLQLDYLKVELKLQELGVEHTIVVFGSARILEKKTALKTLEAVQKRLKRDGESARLLRKLAIAEKMVEKSIYYDDAREFGRLVGKSGRGPEDCRVILMTGGGPGIMEAANRGAYDVGAKSIGLNIQLPHEQYPNPYITPGLCFQFHYFAMRKLHFLNRARALVVYPGGFGTLDELFETLTLVQTHKQEPMPIVMVGRRYWNRLIDFEFLVEEGSIAPRDLDIFAFADSAQEAWDIILNWHRNRKRPLF